MRRLRTRPDEAEDIDLDHMADLLDSAVALGEDDEMEIIDEDEDMEASVP